ncbi:hypothetical protein MNV49_002682 [Pseudohyphozyma bogoriensis]|nr:hypothetical protein MNV49_002682 [Pseudohyphozyma bogoriensis]
MSDLQAYLASKYMTGAKADAILDRAGGDTKLRKKKKRKVDSSSTSIVSGGGMIIADDDGMDWARQKAEEEDDESAPVVQKERGVFKKGKSDWSTIRDADPELAAAREVTPEPEPVDEEPVVVDLTGAGAAAGRSRGGLQSVADLRAENERRRLEQEKKKEAAARELERMKREAKERGEDEDEVEDPHATVYRDASGRRIDMKVEKAEKAKREREELEKQMKKMEWGKGLVQKEDKERERKLAEDLKYRPIARYADDAEMNDEMKDQERWNDPAAAFLTKDKKKSKSSAAKYPSYKGPPPPPNRFGIPPGYRWDGVDRGNGWEAKLMQRGNAIAMRKAEAYAYSTDDM